MTKYLCDDGNAEIEIEAMSPAEAAQQYVDSGDWGDCSSTCWINVWVTPLDEDGEPVEDERANHKITLEAEEPDCEDGDPHDWQSPIEVVVGLEDNPGVFGSGGGVVITEVCARCGMYRITDTWATDPSDGSQGHTSVSYRDADEASLAWVESLRADE